MCGICGCDHHEHHETVEQPSHWIAIEKDLLEQNNQFAKKNRDAFEQHKILALNLVSSPGSGKTTLLESTLTLLKNDYQIAVIEGDQQTDQDAQRIRALGVTAFQINTGKMCHLNADRVHHALHHLALDRCDLLFIENVGNLVCPALFDLGENFRVVMISVTEGDDKPLKYPDIFASADLLLINKIDLLPYVTFDVEKCIAYAKCVNPRLISFKLSATANTGMQAWCDWLRCNV